MQFYLSLVPKIRSLTSPNGSPVPFGYDSPASRINVLSAHRAGKQAQRINEWRKVHTKSRVRKIARRHDIHHPLARPLIQLFPVHALVDTVVVTERNPRPIHILAYRNPAPFKTPQPWLLHAAKKMKHVLNAPLKHLRARVGLALDVLPQRVQTVLRVPP